MKSLVFADLNMTLVKLKTCFILIIYLGYVHNFDIHDLYKQYKDAPGEGPRYLILRRSLRHNATEYQIHIKRLKEVNALKKHNLVRSNDSLPKENETVYITNPVEAKLPQAFLTFDKFKKTILSNVQKDREELRKKKLQAVIKNLWDNRKKRKLTTLKVITPKIMTIVHDNDKYTKRKTTLKEEISPKLTTNVGKAHVGKAQNVNNKTTLAIKNPDYEKNAVNEKNEITKGTPADQEISSTAVNKIIIVPLESVAREIAIDDTTESKMTTVKGQTRNNNHTTDHQKLGNTVANKTKVTLISIVENIALKASDDATTIPTDQTENNESVIESTAFGELELTVDMKSTTESVLNYLGVVTDATDGLNATESSDTGETEETTTPTIETATTAEDKSYEYVEEETEVPTTTTTEKRTLGRPRVFMGG